MNHFPDGLTGTEFAIEVCELLRSMEFTEEEITDILNAGDGPGVVFDALGAMIIALGELDCDSEQLDKLLPEPDGYMPLTRQQTEWMFLDQGVTPPSARTANGFFRILRCMSQLNRLFAGELEIVVVRTEEVGLPSFSLN